MPEHYVYSSQAGDVVPVQAVEDALGVGLEWERGGNAGKAYANVEVQFPWR